MGKNTPALLGIDLPTEESRRCLVRARHAVPVRDGRSSCERGLSKVFFVLTGVSEMGVYRAVIKLVEARLKKTCSVVRARPAVPVLDHVYRNGYGLPKPEYEFPILETGKLNICSSKCNILLII